MKTIARIVDTHLMELFPRAWYEVVGKDAIGRTLLLIEGETWDFEEEELEIKYDVSSVVR